MQNDRLKILTWGEIRDEFSKVNPEFAHIIDEINPSNEFKLVKARYCFGEYVLKNGKLCLPFGDRTLELQHEDMPSEYRKLLEHAYIPLGITLNRSLELFLSIPHGNIIPFAMMYPGKLFALWTILDIAESAHSGKIWNITAGARSTFILPKITEVHSFRRLKKEFGIDQDAPLELNDQWKLFVEINDKAKNDWYVDVVFFSNKWLETNDIAFDRFRKFLLDSGWHNTAFLRNKIIFDLIFSSVLTSKGSRPDPYLADTVKHLHAVGSGFYPSFVFADNELFVPVNLIQKVFVDIYGLSYSPSMMHLDYISRTGKPGYYSLQLPTLMDFSPKSKVHGTNMQDLCDIDAIMQELLNYILNERPDLHHGPIYRWAKDIRHIYLHHRPNKKLITPTSELPLIDKYLEADLKRHKDPKGTHNQKLSFCDSNIFMRGCIQLHINKS